MSDLKESSADIARIGLGGILGGAVAVPALHLMKAAELRAEILKLKYSLDKCPDVECIYRVRTRIDMAKDDLDNLIRTPGGTIKNFLIGATAGTIGAAATGWLGQREPNAVKPDVEIKESIYSIYEKRTKELSEGGEELKLGMSPAAMTNTAGLIGGAIGLGGAGIRYMAQRRKLMQQLAMCDSDDCKAAIRNQLNSLGASSLASGAIAGTAGAAAGYGLGQSGALKAGVDAYKRGDSAGDIISQAAVKLPGVSYMADQQMKRGMEMAQINPKNAAQIVKGERDINTAKQMVAQVAAQQQPKSMWAGWFGNGQ